VQLDVKDILIYLINNFGLEEKGRTIGCEIAIMVDGAKLDDYCIHVTCRFKMMDKDVSEPLNVDEDDELKRGKLPFPIIQSSNKAFPLTSTIAKDSKSTYSRFL
jgi:hypothetical protein